MRLVMNSVGICECSASGNLAVCVSLELVLLTQTQTPMMGDTHKKSCLITSGPKGKNILRLTLIDDATSCCLCFLWMGWWWKRQSQQPSNWLMSCQKMGQVRLGNMWVFTGLYLPEPGARLQLADAGAMNWQAPASKTYDGGWSRGTKNGNAGSLDIWLGSLHGWFGEDGRFWSGKRWVFGRVDLSWGYFLDPF